MSNMPTGPSTSALTDAVQWTVSVLTGRVATILAVLTIAAVGALMLQGRIPVRRGVTVVLGCFILFSAATIADGILAGIGGAAPGQIVVAAPAPAYTPTVPSPAASDPYAGAGVPVQR